MSGSRLIPVVLVSICVAGGALGVGCTPALAAQVIESETSSSVGSTEARVSARIDAGGVPTSYHVEYGTNESYGSVTPESSVGAASQSVSVATQLTGLQPGTEYHYRFAATSALGHAAGFDMVFKTLAAGTGTLALPDHRAYELVSRGEPGEVYGPNPSDEYVSGLSQDVLTELPFRASATGESVAYIGDPGLAGGDGATGSGNGNEILATRDAGHGRWDTSVLTPSPVSKEPEEPFYEGFAGDLSTGVFAAPARGYATVGGEAPIGCEALYASAVGDLRALFTETQTPQSCGFSLVSSAFPGGRLQFAGGNAGAAGLPGFSELLFHTPAPLTPGSVQASEKEAEEGKGSNLYVSQGGLLQQVNVLPGGERDPNAVFGASTVDKRANGNFSDVVSNNGSRVFWSDLTTSGLYVRENPLSGSASTVQLDVRQKEAAGPSGHGRFWTATGDGSKVFFTDCGRLTANSTAVLTANGCERELFLAATNEERERQFTGNDLYMYDFNRPEGERLTDLTVDSHPDPLGADVQGVVGTSGDGSYAYFVAGGALAPGAERGTCKEARKEELEKENARKEKGEPHLPPEERERLEKERHVEEDGMLPAGRGCNLYVEHVGEPPRLIAVLAAKDDHLIRTLQCCQSTVFVGVWQPDLGARTAEVTPSGRQLVFESTQRLTGYDTTPLDAINIERATEVFVYDYSSGRLLCASCNLSGALPVAPPGFSAGGATYLPTSLNPTFMRRWINDEGSMVFFNSAQPLVPQDINGLQDVYEWEREGTTGCPAATSVSGGCVFLLSGGSSSDNSFFVDADSSGSNVFFTHRGALGLVAPAVGQTGLFDARVDGGLIEPSVACAGTGCQGVPPAPPVFATPPSATFSGPGNFSPPQPAGGPKPETNAQKLAKALRACRRDRHRRRRIACGRQARKRYGAARAFERGTGR
jgi:hypothetical protein